MEEYSYNCTRPLGHTYLSLKVLKNKDGSDDDWCEAKTRCLNKYKVVQI